MTVRILFVCAGNICRSPMAEAVFQQLVGRAGLTDQIEIDSAGTGSWEVGQTADPRTLDVLNAHAIPYHGRARQITRGDLDTFDYVLVMDKDNLDGVRRLGRSGRARVGMFLEAANRAGTIKAVEVPDPYFDGTFNRVYDLVTRGGEALLAQIRAEHKL